MKDIALRLIEFADEHPELVFIGIIITGLTLASIFGGK